MAYLAVIVSDGHKVWVDTDTKEVIQSEYITKKKMGKQEYKKLENACGL
jgi:hypothetical protein